MKWWRFAFVILVVACLQASAAMELFSLTELRIKPDLLLILLVYFAINCDSYDAVVISFVLGFAADMAGMVLGPHLISFGIVGTAIAHIRKIILLKSTGQQAIAILAAAVLTGVITLFLTEIKAVELAKTSVFEMFAAGLYSAILWFFLRWPTTAVGKWLGVGAYRFGVKIGHRN